ncbi:MAG TPA: hypothetical protein VM658_17360 [bacterium]|nr:hypothetical protein [bacterium]
MVNYQEWKTERDNWRRLKTEVDSLSRDMVEGKIADQDELRARIESARELCRKLFPDRTALFEMIYPGRFMRQWDEFRREQ